MAVLPDSAVVDADALPRGPGAGPAQCARLPARESLALVGHRFALSVDSSQVGSEYWTEDTVAAVGQRYPGMDMGPYAARARL